MPSIEQSRISPEVAAITRLDFPDDVHLFWYTTQPLKDEQHEYLEVPYTPQEIIFFVETVNTINQRLVDVAKQGDSFVTVSAQTGETRAVIGRHVLFVTNLLAENSDVTYVGFLHGILPSFASIYNAPALFESRDRITTVIISGTRDITMKASEVLTPLPDVAKRAAIVIAGDDLCDTAHSIAAFIERLETERGKRPYDKNFVMELTATQDTPFEQYGDLYKKLVRRMEESGVVISIALYKNKPFLDQLSKYVSKRITEAQPSRWAVTQAGLLLQKPLVFPQDRWLMGEGLDTGILGSVIVRKLKDLYDIPLEQEDMLAHLSLSMLRIGPTINGLIALKDKRVGELMDFCVSIIAERLGLGSKKPNG